MSEYIIDTHALIWYITGNAQMSNTAKNIIAGMINGKHKGYIPGIVIGESIAMLKKRGGLVKINYFLKFLDLYSEAFEYIDIKVEDFFNLKDYIHTEYQIGKKKKKLEIHDSLIIIVARRLNLPIITKDDVITESNFVSVIW